MQIREAVISDDNFKLRDLLEDQHPLMNTWLVLSSVSICVLSAVLLITP
jgi:hypothetical protein